MEHKFGKAGIALIRQIRKIDDPQRLKELFKAILNAATVEDVSKMIS